MFDFYVSQSCASPAPPPRFFPASLSHVFLSMSLLYVSFSYISLFHISSYLSLSYPSLPLSPISHPISLPYVSPLRETEERDEGQRRGRETERERRGRETLLLCLQYLIKLPYLSYLFTFPTVPVPLLPPMIRFYTLYLLYLLPYCIIGFPEKS